MYSSTRDEKTRSEVRKHSQLMVKVKAVNDSNTYDALMRATDISNSGIGLITLYAFPIGTQVEILINDNLAAKGKIVNKTANWNEVDWGGVERVSVQITEKSNAWPI